MLVKHQAFTVKEKKKVYGYAAYINHDYVIISEDGNMVVVDGNSIVPVFKMEEGQKITDRERKFPISECSEISKYLKQMLANKGVFYLEDLQDWTDADYAKLRSVGPKRQKKIQRILKYFNLRYAGKDYLNEDMAGR